MFGFHHALRPPARPVGPDPRLWGHILFFVLTPSSLCVGYYRPTLWDLIRDIISPHPSLTFPLMQLLT